jgi:16S rRNA G966 N2-methylase RsmD
MSVKVTTRGGSKAAISLQKSAAANVDKALAVLAPAVEMRSVDAVKANPRNARRHSARQIAQIAASIREFSFLVPILVDEDSRILAGHGRLAAARQLGMQQVPTLRVDNLTPERKRAFALADNRLAELASWDEDLLRVELAELAALDIDFDFEVTGFNTVDLDLLESGSTDAQQAELFVEPDRDYPAVSQLGDVWLLGPHRLLCGDALNEQSYEALLGEERAQMVFTDPPYNVPVDGHVSGLGRVRHREFPMASGEMTRLQFTQFLATAMKLMCRYSVDGAIHDLCMDWRHMGEMVEAGGEAYAELKNLCVWVKTNAGMGTFYRSQHELVFVFKHGTASHINNFGLGEGGRYRSNVWRYAGVNTFRAGRADDLIAHPTVKPLPMVVDAIKDCSKRKGLILDPFAGSGTTLLAAEKTRRAARCIELDRHYVDVIIGRWQKLTGKAAILANTAEPFAEMAKMRGVDLVAPEVRHD